MTNKKSTARFYDGKTYQVDESIAFLMRQVIDGMGSLVDEHMVEHDLTNAQWKPLLMIRQRNCKTAAELARVSCADTGAVTRMLDRIEAKGLVKRTRSSEDRRIVNLELTEDGEKAAEIVPYVVSDVLNNVLEGFSKTEVNELKALLRRMLANVQAMRASGSQE